MDIKALEAKAIYFEAQVLKVAKKIELLEQISRTQEEARVVYNKSRKLYQEYFDSN